MCLQISGLRSLQLTNVMMPDCPLAFQPFSVLTDLSEIKTSYSFCAENLQHLPQLKVLHIPYFSTPEIHHLSRVTSLEELRCRQTVQEYQLGTFASLKNLHTLQCDNILLTMPDPSFFEQQTMRASLWSRQQQAQANPSYADAMLAWYSAQQLPNIKCLRLMSSFKWRGELGALFPNLESLHLEALDIGCTQLPVGVVPMPKLQRLCWPAGRSLPQLLSACPTLNLLHITGISSQQRMEDALRADTLWPTALQQLILTFQGCGVRFKSRQVRAVLEHLPAPLKDNIRELVLRDVGLAPPGPPPSPGYAAPPNEPGRIVDEGVVVGAMRGLPRMRYLKLETCGGVSCVGLHDAVAASARPVLERLVIAGCPRVRQVMAERLAAEIGKPWLQVEWQASA